MKNVFPFLDTVLQSLRTERHRQELLVYRGKLPFSAANPSIVSAPKLAVLVEEVGEVAKELQGPSIEADRLYAELIQVAAVAVAWAESIQAVRFGYKYPLARGDSLASAPKNAGIGRTTTEDLRAPSFNPQPNPQ